MERAAGLLPAGSQAGLHSTDNRLLDPGAAQLETHNIPQCCRHRPHARGGSFSLRSLSGGSKSQLGLEGFVALSQLLQLSSQSRDENTTAQP